MKVYLSGPMTGIEHFNKKAFDYYKDKLVKNGCEVISPFDISPYQEEKTWKDYMKDDIKCLVGCEAIVMLPGWNESKGARLELSVAISLEIPVFYAETMVEMVIKKELLFHYKVKEKI